jgi:tellurite resistance protein
MARHHDALIYTMVLASVADRDMNELEVESFSEMVRFLPVFRDYDIGDIATTADACVNLMQDEDGIDEAMDFVCDNLPERLRETAYAIACDTVAADGKARQEELRMLEIIRHRLDVDRLTAAAIERGSRARHMTV